MAKVVFSHTNPSNFRQLLQSLLLGYKAENLQVVNKIFKSELFSCLQKVDHVIN